LIWLILQKLTDEESEIADNRGRGATHLKRKGFLIDMESV